MCGGLTLICFFGLLGSGLAQETYGKPAAGSQETYGKCDQALLAKVKEFREKNGETEEILSAVGGTTFNTLKATKEYFAPEVVCSDCTFDYLGDGVANAKFHRYLEDGTKTEDTYNLKQEEGGKVTVMKTDIERHIVSFKNNNCAMVIVCSTAEDARTDVEPAVLLRLRDDTALTEEHSKLFSETLTYLGLDYVNFRDFQESCSKVV